MPKILQLIPAPEGWSVVFPSRLLRDTETELERRPIACIALGEYPDMPGVPVPELMIVEPETGLIQGFAADACVGIDYPGREVNGRQELKNYEEEMERRPSQE